MTWRKGVEWRGALIRGICDVRLERLDAGTELVERARNLAILRVGRKIEGNGTLALKERELDVVGEEEELGRVGDGHGGGVEVRGVAQAAYWRRTRVWVGGPCGWMAGSSSQRRL